MVAAPVSELAPKRRDTGRGIMPLTGNQVHYASSPFWEANCHTMKRHEISDPAQGNPMLRDAVGVTDSRHLSRATMNGPPQLRQPERVSCDTSFATYPDRP